MELTSVIVKTIGADSGNTINAIDHMVTHSGRNGTHCVRAIVTQRRDLRGMAETTCYTTEQAGEKNRKVGLERGFTSHTYIDNEVCALCDQIAHGGLSRRTKAAQFFNGRKQS